MFCAITFIVYSKTWEKMSADQFHRSMPVYLAMIITICLKLQKCIEIVKSQ